VRVEQATDDALWIDEEIVDVDCHGALWRKKG